MKILGTDSVTAGCSRKNDEKQLELAGFRSVKARCAFLHSTQARTSFNVALTSTAMQHYKTGPKQ